MALSKEKRLLVATYQSRLKIAGLIVKFILVRIVLTGKMIKNKTVFCMKG